MHVFTAAVPMLDMWHARLSPQEETTGKQGKSLTLTVGANESMEKDGVTNDLAMGLKTARDEPCTASVRRDRCRG